jgi:hypothetical protein
MAKRALQNRCTPVVLTRLSGERLDGARRYRGLDLPYTTFDKLRQVSQATIVENKHLGAVLSHIRERQIERAESRSQSAPRRQGQVGHMFKVG